MQFIPWWNIELGEEAARRVSDAVLARNVSQGRLTAEFEAALARRLGIPHVVCTTSGTMALTMAYMAAGIVAGDEIIVPNRTWIATANAALLLGASIRVVDSRPGSMLMDEDLIEAAIGPRTKAIVPVPLNGAAVDIERINAIAQRHGLVVIEDACQAIFSQRPDGRCMGGQTRFSCFSLGMAKVLTTGAGGFVACQSEQDATVLRRIRNQGMSDYDLSERHNLQGSNFKFTDLQAAAGLAQIDRIERRVANQKAIYRLYEEGLADVACLRMIRLDLASGELPQRAEVSCTEREAFMAALKENGVGTNAQAPNVADFPFIKTDPALYPRSRVYGTSNLVLPSGPDQPLANVEKAIEVIRKVAPRFRPWE